MTILSPKTDKHATPVWASVQAVRGRGFYFFLLLVLLLPQALPAQYGPFGRADSLRGTLNRYRSCYDVKHYDLEVKIDQELRRIAGSNVIRFQVLAATRTIQIDLFAHLKIGKILYQGRELNFDREHNAVFVDFPTQLQPGTRHEITVFYGGTPIEAKKPPWDGGFVWEKDSNGQPLIGVACEGMGASSWWPLKDHLSDEPDSMRMRFILPEGLKLVSNGTYRGEMSLPGNFTRHEWAVTYPINSYNVTFYIGDYVHFREYYPNASGLHPLDYYVLRGNEKTARAHFRQVKDMLAAFEGFFGEYPFWNDGYALVETAYWGMEHQGAIAYGNGYKNNEFGFDFIIVHESAHEWFGNSLSVGDHAEMWIHEAFATYAEALYVESMEGYEKSVRYLLSQRPSIQNRVAILGPLGVNFDAWPDSDMYIKGSWMLHTLRSAVDDDARWFAALRAFATENRLRILSTREVIDFFNRKLGQNYTWLFDQYLHYPQLPVLEYRVEGKKKKSVFSYRWRAGVEDFRLPVDLSLGGKKIRIHPKTQWQSLDDRNISEDDIRFDTHLGLYELRKAR